MCLCKGFIQRLLYHWKECDYLTHALNKGINERWTLWIIVLHYFSYGFDLGLTSSDIGHKNDTSSKHLFIWNQFVVKVFLKNQTTNIPDLCIHPSIKSISLKSYGCGWRFSLVLFCAYWNTEECWPTFQAKYPKIILLDVVFCQIAFGFQSRYLIFARHRGNKKHFLLIESDYSWRHASCQFISCNV